jgi:hypothetical protein
MRNIAIPVAFVFLFTGCAGIRPINPDGSDIAQAVKDKTISIIVFEEAPIRVLTPGDAVGAGLIDDLTRPDGSNISVPSASYLLAISIKQRLERFAGFQVDDVPDELTKRGQRYSTHQSNGPTLEVYVDINMLSYKSFAWHTYQYFLQGHSRLLAGDGSLLWQSKCKVGGVLSDDKDLQLDRVDFKNNDGQRLKDVMRLGADQCAAELVQQMQIESQRDEEDHVSQR